MDKARIERAVQTILEAILKQAVDPRAGISRSNTPAWDSLKHIEVMFALEDEFGIQFTDLELGRLDSIDSLVDAIGARLAA